MHVYVTFLLFSINAILNYFLFVRQGLRHVRERELVVESHVTLPAFLVSKMPDLSRTLVKFLVDFRERHMS